MVNTKIFLKNKTKENKTNEPHQGLEDNNYQSTFHRYEVPYDFFALKNIQTF